jgi:hypothetical protein
VRELKDHQEDIAVGIFELQDEFDRSKQPRLIG